MRIDWCMFMGIEIGMGGNLGMRMAMAMGMVMIIGVGMGICVGMVASVGMGIGISMVMIMGSGMGNAKSSHASAIDWQARRVWLCFRFGWQTESRGYCFGASARRRLKSLNPNTPDFYVFVVFNFFTTELFLFSPFLFSPCALLRHLPPQTFIARTCPVVG